MNIIIADMTGLSTLIVPIVPINTRVSDCSNNADFSTLKSDLRQIGNEKLKTLKWESTFPSSKNYSYIPIGALGSGLAYVSFLKTMKKLKLPVRVILTSNNNIPIMNMLASIDKFEYGLDKIGDINYSIELTEFPETLKMFINRFKKVFSLETYKNIDFKQQAKKLLIANGLLEPLD